MQPAPASQKSLLFPPSLYGPTGSLQRQVTMMMMFVDSSVKGGWGWKGTESKLTCHVSPCSLHLVHVDVDLYQHQGHYYFLISGVTLAIPPPCTLRSLLCSAFLFRNKFRTFCPGYEASFSSLSLRSRHYPNWAGVALKVPPRGTYIHNGRRSPGSSPLCLSFEYLFCAPGSSLHDWSRLVTWCWDVAPVVLRGC